MRFRAFILALVAIPMLATVGSTAGGQTHSARSEPTVRDAALDRVATPARISIEEEYAEFTVFVSYRTPAGIVDTAQTTCREMSLEDALACAQAGATAGVRLYNPSERGATIIPPSIYEGPLGVFWTGGR